MPGYAFETLIKFTEDEFDMKFKSMKDLYLKEEGDPIKYLRELAEQETQQRPEKILQGAGRTKRLMPGRFYMMKYMPKNRNKKDILPYYDMFPVILVMNMYDTYFSGLNFHYIPPMYRAEIMDELYKFVIAPEVKSKEIGTSIRARVNTNRVTYDFMKSRFSLRSFKPLWKRYDYKQVVGPYLYIPPIGWDAITMMPVHRFRGTGINRVWRDSLEERRRRR